MEPLLSSHLFLGWIESAVFKHGQGGKRRMQKNRDTLSRFRADHFVD
jgi:hypothetical protein